MAKKDKPARMLICERSGEPFEYRGYGRPPKYCPAVKEQIVQEQRKAARARVKAKRAPNMSAQHAAV